MVGLGNQTWTSHSCATYQPFTQGIQTHVLLSVNPLTLGSLFLCTSVVCQVWPITFFTEAIQITSLEVSRKMSVNFTIIRILLTYVNSLFIGEISARLIGFYKNI